MPRPLGRHQRPWKQISQLSSRLPRGCNAQPQHPPLQQRRCPFAPASSCKPFSPYSDLRFPALPHGCAAFLGGWRVAALPLSFDSPITPLPLQAAWNVAKVFGYATTSKEELTDFLEQATGPEREELEAKAAGIENPWHEAWCVFAPLSPPAAACRAKLPCSCAGASLAATRVQQLPPLPPSCNARLDAPFGTEDNPVVVPSECAERIVGVNDPDDDSLVRGPAGRRSCGSGGAVLLCLPDRCVVRAKHAEALAVPACSLGAQQDADPCKQPAALACSWRRCGGVLSRMGSPPSKSSREASSSC